MKRFPLLRKATIYQNEHKKSGAVSKLHVSEQVVTDDNLNIIRYRLVGTLLTESIYRLYDDFLSLRKKLVQRWPGIYIPDLAINKELLVNDKKMAKRNIEMLNDFCYKIVKFDFIILSEEFQVFISVNQNTSKVINNLPEFTYSELFDQYQRAFPEYDKDYNYEEGHLKLSNLITQIKKALMNYESFKESVSLSRIKNEDEIKYYKALLTACLNFEKYALLEFVDNDEKKLIFFNPQNDVIFQKLSEIKDNLINPFTQLEDWLQDDILDFKSMLHTLESLHKFHETLSKYKAKLNSLNNKIKENEEGKESFFSYISFLFNWKDDAQITEEINEEKYDIEMAIDNIEEIIKISYNRIEHHIEIFKVEKLERYRKHIKNFSDDKYKTSNVINNLWTFINKIDFIKKANKNKSGTNLFKENLNIANLNKDLMNKDNIDKKYFGIIDFKEEESEEGEESDEKIDDDGEQADQENE